MKKVTTRIDDVIELSDDALRRATGGVGGLPELGSLSSERKTSAEDSILACVMDRDVSDVGDAHDGPDLDDVDAGLPELGDVHDASADDVASCDLPEAWAHDGEGGDDEVRPGEIAGGPLPEVPDDLPGLDAVFCGTPSVLVEPPSETPDTHPTDHDVPGVFCEMAPADPDDFYLPIAEDDSDLPEHDGLACVMPEPAPFEPAELGPWSFAHAVDDCRLPVDEIVQQVIAQLDGAHSFSFSIDGGRGNAEWRTVCAS